MIPASYDILLRLVGIKWTWTILDDEEETVARGSDGDYTVACAAALQAHDTIRSKESQQTL